MINSEFSNKAGEDLPLEPPLSFPKGLGSDQTSPLFFGIGQLTVIWRWPTMMVGFVIEADQPPRASKSYVEKDLWSLVNRLLLGSHRTKEVETADFPFATNRGVGLACNSHHNWIIWLCPAQHGRGGGRRATSTWSLLHLSFFELADSQERTSHSCLMEVNPTEKSAWKGT